MRMEDPAGLTFAGIADAVDVGIALLDEHGRIRYANTTLGEYCLCEPGVLVGGPLQIELHPSAATGYESPASPQRQNGVIRRADGSELFVELSLRSGSGTSAHTTIATVRRLAQNYNPESTLRSVIAAAPYGILMTNTAGIIVIANEALCRMFGYDEHALLLQPVDQLLPHRQRTSHVQQRTGFAREPRARTMGAGRDLTGLRKDGVEIPVEIALSSVDLPAGRFIIAAVIDITERKRTELQLRDANAQLEEFSYVSSHDLRSPLRGIGSLVEFIREDLGEAAPADITHNLDRMRDRVQKMERLIDDLLAYARAGRRTVNFETIDLERIVSELPALQAGPAGFSFDAQIAVTGFQGARVPLETVIRNLYSNALKHHDAPEQGHVVIRALVDGDYCRIEVEDDGPGIPAAVQERIFRLFQTLTAKERHGSGLGLAVAKRLVEVHSGRIDVLSRDGCRGSTFRVWWPLYIRSDLNE